MFISPGVGVAPVDGIPVMSRSKSGDASFNNFKSEIKLNNLVNNRL